MGMAMEKRRRRRRVSISNKPLLFQIDLNIQVSYFKEELTLDYFFAVRFCRNMYHMLNPS
jgi:hypothetical protein